MFDNSFTTPALAGLTAGQWVEVNGLRNSAGEVVVTRIEPRAANGEIELNGTISALDTTFSGTGLTATRVEVRSCTLTTSNNDNGEIEGFVTRFASASDFDVGTQKVTTTATSSYSGGVVGDMALNKRIEVAGTFNASSILVATRGSFKTDTTTRFQGTVDALTRLTRHWRYSVSRSAPRVRPALKTT